MFKEKKMKKYFDYILLCLSIVFGTFILVSMSATGVNATDTTGLGMIKDSFSVYALITHNDTMVAGLVLALIFSIIALVIPACLLICKLLKVNVQVFVKIDMLLSFVGGILSLIASILFFCTKSLIGGDTILIKYSLGIGAILCGIFALLTTASLIVYSIKRIIKN